MRILLSLIIGGLLMPLYSAVSIQQPIDSPWQLDEYTIYKLGG